MQTQKAITFAKLIDQACNTYAKVLWKEITDEVELEIFKVEFDESSFKQYFSAFEDELNQNIDEYRKLSIIHAYVLCHFEKFTYWDPFHPDDELRIMKQGFEVQFLIKLKTCVEKYGGYISDLCQKDKFGDAGIGLAAIYKERIKWLNSKGNQKEVEQIIPLNKPKKKPPVDDRFDFKNMKSKSDQQATTNDKIKFIHERLFDLEQWEILNDEEVDDPDFGTYYNLSNLYYPNFRELCSSELKRLEKITELEKKVILKETKVVVTQNTEPSGFIWNTTDTNLLELVAALYQVNAIKLKDGSKLTRVELIEYFETMFGFQIKDAEVKLTLATNRNENTPFLEGLTLAFKNYAKEKEVKQQKRK